MFQAVYCGFSVLDRHYTPSMLPWINAEVVLNAGQGNGGSVCEREDVCVRIHGQCLQVLRLDQRDVLFEHDVCRVFCFSRLQHDPRCFGYLTRACGVAPFVSHVFIAYQPTQISELYINLQRINKKGFSGGFVKSSTLLATSCPASLSPGLLPAASPADDPSCYTNFEVEYVGRVRFSNEDYRPTSALIDEAVTRFNESLRSDSDITSERHESCSSEDSEVFLSSPRKKLEIRNFSEEPGDARFAALVNLQKTLIERRHPSEMHAEHDRSLLSTASMDMKCSGSSRVMILLIGQTDMCLFSLDKKRMLLQKQMKYICAVIQGGKFRDHVGFISSDPAEGFVCFTLRAQSEIVASNIVHFLRSSCMSVWNQTSVPLRVCSSCPLHQFSRLCSDIEGRTSWQAYGLILRRISQIRFDHQELVLSEYKEMIKEKFQECASEAMVSNNPKRFHERNVILMALLRRLCEAQQALHTHIAEMASGSPFLKKKVPEVNLSKTKSPLPDPMSSPAWETTPEGQVPLSPYHESSHCHLDVQWPDCRTGLPGHNGSTVPERPLFDDVCVLEQRLMTQDSVGRYKQRTKSESANIVWIDSNSSPGSTKSVNDKAPASSHSDSGYSVSGEQLCHCSLADDFQECHSPRCAECGNVGYSDGDDCNNNLPNKQLNENKREADFNNKTKESAIPNYRQATPERPTTLATAGVILKTTQYACNRAEFSEKPLPYQYSKRNMKNSSHSTCSGGSDDQRLSIGFVPPPLLTSALAARQRRQVFGRKRCATVGEVVSGASGKLSDSNIPGGIPYQRYYAGHNQPSRHSERNPRQVAHSSAHHNHNHVHKCGCRPPPLVTNAASFDLDDVSLARVVNDGKKQVFCKQGQLVSPTIGRSNSSQSQSRALSPLALNTSPISPVSRDASSPGLASDCCCNEKYRQEFSPDDGNGGLKHSMSSQEVGTHSVVEAAATYRPKTLVVGAKSAALRRKRTGVRPISRSPIRNGGLRPVHLLTEKDLLLEPDDSEEGGERVQRAHSDCEIVDREVSGVYSCDHEYEEGDRGEGARGLPCTKCAGGCSVCGDGNKTGLLPHQEVDGEDSATPLSSGSAYSVSVVAFNGGADQHHGCPQSHLQHGHGLQQLSRHGSKRSLCGAEVGWFARSSSSTSSSTSYLSSAGAAGGSKRVPSFQRLSQRRMSWRQQIFQKIVTPPVRRQSSLASDIILETGGLHHGSFEDGSSTALLSSYDEDECLSTDGLMSPISSMAGSAFKQLFLRRESSGILAGSGRRDSHANFSTARRGSTPQFFRALWRKAISEQILMLRMEKQKRKIIEQRASEDEALQRSKLEYEEITPCSSDEARPVWERLIAPSPDQPSRRFEYDQLADAVKLGIPREMRGLVWRFLLEQHGLRRPGRRQDAEPAPPPYDYQELLKELTPYQHAILIDLGRTFPHHPYFAQQFGPGQLSLFNVLKAYSLYDSDVGYCQGLSFIAGVLLLHMDEEEVFDLLARLMFRLGLRHQYRPDMMALQVQMYQMSRLLRDYHPDLYDHLETHEVPTLYAAPWFLTLFASTFPLGFVARVLDLVFLTGGLDIIFNIAIILLGDHKELIKHCTSFETINDFLKNTLPSMSIIQMERIFNQVLELDISRDILSYAVEYQVLQEEMMTADAPDMGLLQPSDQVQRLDALNRNLRKQNMELLEQLRDSHAKLTFSETSKKDLENKLQSAHNTIDSYKCKVSELNNRINTLEFEHKSLLKVISRMGKHLPVEWGTDQCSATGVSPENLLPLASSRHSTDSGVPSSATSENDVPS